MPTFQRSARIARIYRHRRLVFVSSILLAGFLLTGVVTLSLGEPLAPLTCPPPAAPSSFWGYITLNGAPAPVGVKLAAWVNGVEVASTTTQASGSSTYYLIDVPERAYDSVTGQVCRQGGAAGETVSFVLCTYVTANETGTWAGGTQVQRDLTASGSCSPATNTPTATATSTWTFTPTLPRPRRLRPRRPQHCRRHHQRRAPGR